MIIPTLKKSDIKIKKGSFTPFKMKEYQKLFTEKRNKLYMNNFYIQRQKIFDLLLDKNKDNDNKKKDIKEISSSYSHKMKISNTETNYSTQVKDQLNLILKNKIDNYINNNKIIKTKIPALKIEKNIKNKIRNKEGFIDILCLDNWEEKENFKTRFLSENII